VYLQQTEYITEQNSHPFSPDRFWLVRPSRHSGCTHHLHNIPIPFLSLHFLLYCAVVLYVNWLNTLIDCSPVLCQTFGLIWVISIIFILNTTSYTRHLPY